MVVCWTSSDAHDLWSDTALILTTDHGFLLGEHDWWAKNRMPVYDEIAHIPPRFIIPILPMKEGRVVARSPKRRIYRTIRHCRQAIPKDVTGRSLIKS